MLLMSVQGKNQGCLFLTEFEKSFLTYLVFGINNFNVLGCKIYVFTKSLKFSYDWGLDVMIWLVKSISAQWGLMISSQLIHTRQFISLKLGAKGRASWFIYVYKQFAIFG